MKIVGFKVNGPKRVKTWLVNSIIFVMLGVVAFLGFAGGSMQVFNEKGLEAIYAGERGTNTLSLMINVYWGDEYIEPMLDVLEEYGATTTFFVGGVWASKNAEMMNEILRRGHEIANHGYYHKDQGALSAEENLREISQTHQIVKSLTGVEMNLFAPPSGAFSRVTLEVATGLGYRTVMWTRDTIDWRDKDAALITSRATKDAVGGDLVLMHPTEKTLEAIPDILDTLKAKGLEVRPVSEVLGNINN